MAKPKPNQSGGNQPRKPSQNPQNPNPSRIPTGNPGTRSGENGIEKK